MGRDVLSLLIVDPERVADDHDGVLYPMDKGHLMRRYFPKHRTMSMSEMQIFKSLLDSLIARNRLLLEELTEMQGRLRTANDISAFAEKRSELLDPRPILGPPWVWEYAHEYRRNGGLGDEQWIPFDALCQWKGSRLFFEEQPSASQLEALYASHRDLLRRLKVSPPTGFRGFGSG